MRFVLLIAVSLFASSATADELPPASTTPGPTLGELQRQVTDLKSQLQQSSDMIAALRQQREMNGDQEAQVFVTFTQQLKTCKTELHK